MSYTEKWLEEHKEEMVEALKGCLRFKSLKAAPEANAPFGKNIRDCLDYTLGLAEKLGFETADVDGYVGLVDAGEGSEELGILGHLDVVPEGSGWLHGAYDAVIDGDKLYGRGAIDDKGPLIASLFALKAVMESGAKFRRRVRIIMGCDEENGMSCLEYFKAHSDHLPDLAFSPDGDFPITISEKHILQFKLVKKYHSNVSAASGEAANVCPAYAEGMARLSGGRIERFQAKGVQAHASLPWQGENAIAKLISEMADAELQKEDKETAQLIKTLFCGGYYGEGLGMDYSDESGRQTVNLGVLRWNAEGISLTVDMRCPTSLTEAGIKAAVNEKISGSGFEIESWKFEEGYSIAEDSEIAKTLLEVFRNRSGLKDAEPLRIGGGTYARRLPNAVSFGPENYMCEASAHVANEFISLDQLMFIANAIADAIYKLCCE